MNKTHFDPKILHENSTTNIEWNALKPTLLEAWEVRGKHGDQHIQYDLFNVALNKTTT